MDKDIQELTQNERYDLKRKQVMEEKEAYTNSSLENFTEHCFSSRLIDRLTEDIERLKKQLDREIHINREMKSALETYSYEENWDCLYDDPVYGKDPDTNWNKDGNGYDLAKEVLKEIDNKE